FLSGKAQTRSRMGYTARGCNAAWRKKTPFNVSLFLVCDTSQSTKPASGQVAGYPGGRGMKIIFS
ncbi:MAG: hypothetical protein EPO42_08495, partial [Gallionellaceae bacterium]